MATDLISLDEAEEAVKAGGTAPASVKAQLPKFISAASALIQSPDLAGPIVYEERSASFDGGRGSYVLPVAPATALTVTVDDSLIASTSWVGNTTSGTVTYKYGTFASGFQNVVITYSVGSLDAVPDNIKLACMELVTFLWQGSRQGARRDAEEVIPRGFAVPRRVRDLCQPQNKALGFA